METMALTLTSLMPFVKCIGQHLVPPEGSLDKTTVNEVYRVIIGNPGHPDHFPYTDCWQDAVLN
jgi:hypothetical protein